MRSTKDNLFQPMSSDTERDIRAGDGGELTGAICKMQALHSSSALGVNIFDYWRGKSLISIAKALRVPSSGANELTFEDKLPHASFHTGDFSKASNIDVLLRYNGVNTAMVAIECKYSEAYGSGHPGIRPIYLKHDSLWTEFPHLQLLAQSISPNDTSFKHLHPAQLIKHILGLYHACAKYKKPKNKFRLLYLWYDVPTEDGMKHRQEIERFTEIVVKDDVQFDAITYQEVIHNLYRQDAFQEHKQYIQYLENRYL